MVKGNYHIDLDRALDYWTVIDDSVAKNRDLCKFETYAEDWDAIICITHWLKSFRSAMTQMSTTKCSMLPLTHTVYKNCFSNYSMSYQKMHLISSSLAWPAHMESYVTTSTMVRSMIFCITWASCEYYWSYPPIATCSLFWLVVLDPWISYKGLLTDLEMMFLCTATLSSHESISRHTFVPNMHKICYSTAQLSLNTTSTC